MRPLGRNSKEKKTRRGEASPPLVAVGGGGVGGGGRGGGGGGGRGLPERGLWSLEREKRRERFHGRNEKARIQRNKIFQYMIKMKTFKILKKVLKLWIFVVAIYLARVCSRRRLRGFGCRSYGGCGAHEATRDLIARAGCACIRFATTRNSVVSSLRFGTWESSNDSRGPLSFQKDSLLSSPDTVSTNLKIQRRIAPSIPWLRTPGASRAAACRRRSRCRRTPVLRVSDSWDDATTARSCRERVWRAFFEEEEKNASFRALRVACFANKTPAVERGARA